MYLDNLSSSRYAVECPVCETRFRPGIGKSQMGTTTFNCPTCGEVLKYAGRYDALILSASIVAGLIFAYKLGYAGVKFAAVMAISAFLTFLLLLGIMYHASPPKA